MYRLSLGKKRTSTTGSLLPFSYLIGKHWLFFRFRFLSKVSGEISRTGVSTDTGQAMMFPVEYYTTKECNPVIWLARSSPAFFVCTCCGSVALLARELL